MGRGLFGVFGFGALCAGIGAEIKNRTQIRRGVMKGSKPGKRRIVHDPTDSTSLHLAGGSEQLKKRRARLVAGYLFGPSPQLPDLSVTSREVLSPENGLNFD